MGKHADLPTVEDLGLASQTTLYAMASAFSKPKAKFRAVMLLRIHASIQLANRRILDELRA